MEEKKRNSRIPDIILAAVMMCAIISLSVVIVLNFRPLYYMDMKTLDIPGSSGYSAGEIRENYDALIDYNSMFFTGELEFPTLPQSEGGRIHFVEVKNIFVFFQKAALVTVILSIAGIWLLRRERPKRYLKYAGILTLALPLFVGAAIAVNWNRAFVLFHELMFDNDYWLFDPVTDPVINILPDAFFMHCAVGIVGLVVVGAGVCLAGYGISKRRQDKIDYDCQITL